MKKKINIEFLCTLIGIHINRLYSYSQLVIDVELLFDKIAIDIKNKIDLPDFEGELNTNLKIFRFKNILESAGYSSFAYSWNTMPKFMANIFNKYDSELSELIDKYKNK